MIFAEIANALILVWSHKTSRICVLLIVFVSLLLSIFFSIFASLIILICYLTGCIVSFCLVKYQYEVGFCLHRLASIYHGHLTPKKKYDKGCNICDDLYCTRHQNNANKEPWKGIIISNDLNEAVEDFYNKILDNFIITWYKNLTDDDTFINELRVSLRYATSTIINRYTNIDLGLLITNKLIPCALRHIHDYLKIQEKLKKEKGTLEKVAVEYFGKRLHAAVTNRENELGYLRSLTSCLLPHILPKTAFKCKNYNILMREILAGWVLLPLMDVIADPNIINLLLNITVNYKKKHHPRITYNDDEKVEILCNFTNYVDMKSAALGHDLTRIIKTPDMLYAFMQFLKEEGPVNVLQFCLDVEEFNKKLLTPELSENELEKLHAEASQIYEIYLRENSPDSIDCPWDIRTSLEHLLQSGPYNIVKLRTSTPLYKSYDFAFGILENKWVPLFYHSDEFYKLVCGPRISSNYQKLAVNRNKKCTDTSNQGTVSKISSGFHRIRGALKTPQPIDGAVYHVETQTFETVPSLFIEQNIYRDLSAWRVSINNVEHVSGPKAATIFYINVKRIDTCSENERSWTVQRQDQDFYTLKIKLVEFHGESEICDSPLPSRRSSTPIETRRQKYEEFLQKLLQKPSLRGSDLLHTFLTTEQNFTLLADTSLPIVSDLGNIYQSVAHKLRKEKGQHLDSFMSTFLQSTESEKSKPGKFESPDVCEEADSGILMEGSHSKTKNIKSSIFGNNFSVLFPKETTYTQMTFSPCDIIQCSSYLLSNIFHAPQGVIRFFLAVCNVAHDAIDYFARILIEHQIKSSLSEHTLAHLIHLLKDILFIQKFTPPTKAELEQRKILAFNNISKIKRGVMCYWLGIEINKGLSTLLQILQSPQLNKQLAYSLLDIIIMELYPDCNLNKTTKLV